MPERVRVLTVPGLTVPGQARESARLTVPEPERVRVLTMPGRRLQL